MLKTASFTLMHFCIAFGVAYLLTGSIAIGGLLAIIEPLCNAVGFYFHERLWQRLEASAGDDPPGLLRAWRHEHA